jgi:hypothetical protein
MVVLDVALMDTLTGRASVVPLSTYESFYT